MNVLKSLMKGITFGLPWMKQSVQHKPSEAKISLAVLLQLALHSLTGPMLGLGNVQEMQQLRILVKKKKVIIKMMLASVLQVIIKNMKLKMRRDLNLMDRLLLLILMDFNCMKICCCRS
jgi:hypothetical protein